VEIQRIKLYPVLDEWNPETRASFPSKQFVVPHEIHKDDLSGGGQTPGQVDISAIVVLDRIGWIGINQIPKVQTGWWLRSALKADEAGNVIAFVLTFSIDSYQKKNQKTAAGT
jgi:hypothetical protein